MNRRRLLSLAGVAAAGGLSACAKANQDSANGKSKETQPGSTGTATGATRPSTPAEALKRLKAGNRRWVADNPVHPDQDHFRRSSLAKEQHPFAAIFTCIDSRVPMELVFDEGLGDLFGIRTAAQTLDDLVLGSLQYGPLESGTPLIVVVGHERCGAVTAAVEAYEDASKEVPGGIGSIVTALRPAYEEAVKKSIRDKDALIDTVVRAHTRLTVRTLRRDAHLSPLLAAGRLDIVGAYYSLDTGAVSFG
ncbi:carbonic anhydrase [Streptomyces sp. N35]|uniref:carbonic anhydrase n=1 Tax=Streptomyces sp. N35 TaxID=2795730 RepID=UPI0018F7A01E|nr:carbonic anhydrase [Streptomyces sp. N35]